ncbi:nuclear factor of activated T-cells 5 [Oncorhynchus tshawytscha]|uniref:Nuclear factor of activated T-cells 5 n=1 Tax=Oncorhynchus tshawytscha TaxID=74940 RepID=A0A8C8JAY3_ONCTS|nr:nuclear factor of activated T-cells 5 [Oncorhynchus tshawytscha]
MPSDFISLSSDLDLNSPKSLYSKESVYDLLPKELQLQPSSSKTDTPTMSQKSGGEAGPPPSASLASDAASSTSSPSPSSSQDMGDPCTTGPRPSTAPSTSAMEQPQPPLLLHHLSSAPREGSGDPVVSEMQGVEGALSTLGGGCCSGTSSGTGGGDPGAGGVGAQQQPQNTPSKRRPVLSISPPPEDLFDDSNMSCQEDPAPAGPAGPDSEHSSSIWADDSASNFSLISSSSYNDNTEVPRKSRKRTPRQRPGPKPAPPEDSMDVFDADSAKAPHFVLSQLGPDKASPKPSSLEAGCLLKGCLLSGQYPQKSEGKELKILLQPETQHRARYLTEGSRGSVKDRTQQGFPTVKLEGVSEPVVLQVFVASDTGRVKPHGFYQACRVTGRNTKACKEVDIEGTTVIEVPLEPSNAMSLAVDCVGILKLRNADVEARIGVAGSKKKSTRARLAFRVNIPHADGSVLTLQTTSSPILCTQPAGVPEILKKSLHSCSVRGGEELFIIGKNFLKGTKVIFQENPADDNLWQAEAEIDMELFHQNHVIVKVPPYHNLSVSSPVSVGVYIMTNAGRSHDIQPFTYTPDSEHSLDVSVKTEGSSLAKACTFQDQIKSLASDPAQSAGELVKRQEVTPMEVSSNPPSTALFKPSSDTLVSVQQTLELSSSTPPSTESFPSPMPLQPGEVDFPQSPVFPSLEPLCTIQKQDIAPTTSFPVSSDNTTLPPVPPEVPQQFLRDPQESLPQDSSNPSSEVVVVGMSQMAPHSQSQLPLFPQDGVAQLERAVRELQAGGSDLVQQVMEAAVAQQQLNSVLYSPTPSTDSLQQHVQDTMNSLRLGGAEGSLATQHLQIQQQQQQILGNMHQQQQQLHQQQVLGNIQLQQQLLLQPQDQQLQQQILGNLQQHQQFQQQQQVLGNIQLHDHQQLQQQQQVLDNLQHQNQALGNLQQHQLHQQQLQQQLQTEFLQPQIHSSSQPQQQQQPVSLLQQTGELLTIQTSSFPQEPPSHSSPPQQLFQSPRPLSETSSPQHQAALLQNTLTVLTSGSLSQEQQATGSTLFLSPNTLSNQGSQQQLAFLSSMETSACEPQTMSMFQAQQQQSTPMDHQQTQLQQTQQLPMAQQSSLFQTSILPPSQHPQPQPTGLLLCTASLKPQALPPALLFSTQAQGPSMGNNSTPCPQDTPASLLFSQPTMVGVRVEVGQTDPVEPMLFQDQSSSVGGTPASRNTPPQGLFQGPQPMQVGSSSVNGPPSHQVDLFLPQGSLSGLQGSMATQELGNQAAAGETIFVMQSGLGVVGLQSTTSSPGKRPPEQLFQTGVSGNVGQPGGQPNLFVFGLQNDSSQLMPSSGSTMSAQSQPQNHNPLQASHIQPLMDPNMAQTATPMQTNLQTPMQTGLQNAMSSLENALQANLQTPMQTNIQTTIETTPMQTNMQTNLQTPMQTNMQTNLQTPMQTNLQTPMSASQNMEKIEDLLESLQEQ